jgi:DnaK suppressor protein
VDLVRNIADRSRRSKRIECTACRLVDGALREIREGTFGVCAQCGDDIPVNRLEAVPWSPYCVSCQERAEERAEQSERNEQLAEGETTYALAS